MKSIKRMLTGISLLAITACCNQFVEVGSELLFGIFYFGGRLTFVLGLIFVIAGMRTKDEQS